MFLPYIANGIGATPLPDATAFTLAFIAADGAWLVKADGSGKVHLTDVALATGTILSSPLGNQLAVDTGNGWSVFDLQGNRLAEEVGAGYTLRWHYDNQALLLAQLSHGIDRYDLATGQSTALLTTSDVTNDHSPFWSANQQKLLFAHQEFGQKLYVTLINNFDNNKVPYVGENRAGGKLNPNFTLLLETDSWHDQPIGFQWAANEQKVVFGAKTTIHVLDLPTGGASKIEPAGFGLRDSGQMVDVANDQIVYFGADGIYTVDLQGQNPRRIVAGNDFHYPQWAPTGNAIVFGGPDHFLYVVDLLGNTATVIPNTAGAQHFALFAAAAVNQ